MSSNKNYKQNKAVQKAAFRMRVQNELLDLDLEPKFRVKNLLIELTEANYKVNIAEFHLYRRAKIALIKFIELNIGDVVHDVDAVDFYVQSFENATQFHKFVQVFTTEEFEKYHGIITQEYERFLADLHVQYNMMIVDFLKSIGIMIDVNKLFQLRLFWV